MHKTLLLLFLPALIACAGKTSSKPKESNNQQASEQTQVVVAVPMTLDVLPLLVADAHGYFKQHNIPIAFRVYPSQADCDTAFLGQAQGICTDRLGQAHLGSVAQSEAPLLVMHRQWGLVASAGLRIRHLKEMKDRTVAAAKYSYSDETCTEALRQNGLPDNFVLRPRINSFTICSAMVQGGQVDGAVLPEPYLTEAVENGCKLLYSGTSAQSFLLIKRKSLSRIDTRRLSAVYNQASDSINQRGISFCQDILMRQYHLNPAVINKLKLPHYARQ